MMGNSGNKLNYRNSLHQLHNNLDTPNFYQDKFWKQFWPEVQLVDINELFLWISCAELRSLREENPQNFVKLVVFCSEQLINCSTTTFCNTIYQQNVALNCCRLLIRILPYVYEDEDFTKIFWSNVNLSNENNSDKSNNENTDHEVDNNKLTNENLSNSDFDSDQENLKKLKLNTNKKKTKQNVLAIRLINSICDLLFCPEFTVIPAAKSMQNKSKIEPDSPPIELNEIDSCEFIWQSGVGFTSSNINSSKLINFNFTNTYNIQNLEKNRIDLLRLLLVMFSETMYKSPTQVENQVNKYLQYFTCSENRHCLPLFTSLLNTVLAYQPNSSYFSSFYNVQNNIDKEQLAELCIQIMIACLDHDFTRNQIESQNKTKNSNSNKQLDLDLDENMSNDYCSNMVASNIDNINNHNVGFNAEDSNTFNQTDKHSKDEASHFFDSNFIDPTLHENLFINYLARLHREKDFQFILNGFVSLLNIPLISTYLSNNNHKIQFNQELLILFWKFCDLNKKFLYFTLKSSKILEILTPILYHLNESKGDQSKLGLIHIGVFIILLLSGERNFGVRLNKPFNNSSIIFKQIPIFSGTHADLLIIVFHKLITTGSTKLQSLFECLLTIIVNISPYLKTLTMVSANKLLHFFEAFSTPWFLYCNQNNHHLIFYLLEIFNNIIQYQFDGNSNLIYTLIRKRNCFHQLVNLPTDYYFICKSLNKPEKKIVKSQSMLAYKEIDYSLKKSSSINNLKFDKNQKEETKNSLNKSDLTKNDVDNLPNDLPENSKTEVKNIHQDIYNNLNIENEKNSNENDAQLKSEKDVNQINKIKNLDNDYKVKKNDNKKEKTNKSLNQSSDWKPTPEWVASWKKKLPLQTIMRMLQVLIPQVEKICLDKGITDENDILKFLEHGTLVGLLPVPHPILIRKYQTNSGTTLWFRIYMWGIIYLRNINPPIWYDTEVKLFEIQKI